MTATMGKPRFKRRKEERPAEITAAAMDAFAKNGYAATRVEEVARRAGVSKGLLYLYFKTKEDLFKSVVQSFVSPRVDALIGNIEQSSLSTEEFLRGPFLAFAKSVPKSRVRILVRLIVAEGPKHPDLVDWYWQNVVQKAIAALRVLVSRGVERGELKKSALDEFPQLIVAPVLFSVLWTQIFQAQSKLDTDRFIESHIDLLLTAVKVQK